MHDPLRFVRPDFRDLDEYVPVKPLDVLAREIGVPVERLVKLDANENLYGAPKAVFDAIAGADLHIYPDPAQTALREAIGEYVGVSPEQVVAGAGSDDLIDIIIRLVLPKATVSAPPTFGMYRFLSSIAGAEHVEVPRRPRFEVDLEGIEAAVRGGASIVFLPSPNNPTGNTLTRAELQAACEFDALVVVDEAYAEFSGTSYAGDVARYPNLVVLRTFSKWAGLAGLRVGYAVCHPDLASRMMTIKQPYNVNVAADVAARAAIAHRGEIMETVRCLVAERERLARELAEFDWLEPVPSEANFVLVRVTGRPAAEVAAGLRRQGVLVRYYDRPDLRGYIRISAGRPEDTDRLLEALRNVGQV
ncbi:MAG: histidinol-phosphate transaminase [Dehalococcoidia bacterium]